MIGDKVFLVGGERIRISLFKRILRRAESWLIYKLGAQRFEYTAELPISCDFSETGLEYAVDMMKHKWGSKPSFVLVQSLKMSMDELNDIKSISDTLNVHYEVTDKIPLDSWLLFDKDGNCVYSRGAW